MQKILTALTGVNLMLCVFLLTEAANADTDRTEGMLRARGLQILDDRGRVRAALAILPASPSTSETVILRMINADGQPSVKLATSSDGAGLSLVGGDDVSYITLTAEGPEARLKMLEPGGRVFEKRP